MALREAVLAEAQDLLEHPLGEVNVIPPLAHALHQPLAERPEPTLAAPGGHGPAQSVRLAGGEAGGHHRKLHDLLLEDGHAVGTFEHLAHRLAGVVHRLQPLATAQIGMDHVALDGTRPDDGDLHHQVVEGLRPHAGEHRHLRPGLHLEHPHRVRPADHVVDRRVALRDVAQAQGPAVVARDELEAAPDRGEHAQRQAVHLEQSQGLQVVLVPLDHGAPGHGGVLRGHQLRQRPAGDHEPAHVLGEVTGETQQLAGEHDQPVHHRALGVQAGLAHTLVADGAPVPPLHGTGQPLELVLAQTERTAHVAQGAARAVGDHRGGQRRALATVAAVDVLDHLLAALVLEVHVDVRRLAPLGGDETLE